VRASSVASLQASSGRETAGWLRPNRLATGERVPPDAAADPRRQSGGCDRAPKGRPGERRLIACGRAARYFRLRGSVVRAEAVSLRGDSGL
jgi:hypothetical protein